jgi:hypothetical protein
VTKIAILLITRLAILLGGISRSDVQKVLAWIDNQAKLYPDKPGLQKLDTVLDRFKEFFGNNEHARTIVQMIYTAWKLKNAA